MMTFEDSEPGIVNAKEMSTIVKRVVSCRAMCRVVQRVVSCRATCAACYMQTEFTDLTIKNTH